METTENVKVICEIQFSFTENESSFWGIVNTQYKLISIIQVSITHFMTIS